MESPVSNFRIEYLTSHPRRHTSWGGGRHAPLYHFQGCVRSRHFLYFPYAVRVGPYKVMSILWQVGRARRKLDDVLLLTSPVLYEWITHAAHKVDTKQMPVSTAIRHWSGTTSRSSCLWNTAYMPRSRVHVQKPKIFRHLTQTKSCLLCPSWVYQSRRKFHIPFLKIFLNIIVVFR